jgi:predicted nucleotide-binding protein
MLVHGQDAAAVRAMFDWLRSIGLRPSEWSQLVKTSGTASPFIGDVLIQAFRHAQAVVVLFTPDEHARLRSELSDESWRLQSRPNVLFEAGMAFASHPERTVLAVLGDQELPSDLAGRHYVRIGSAQTLRDLGLRLEAAGCPADLTGTDWLDDTRFPDRRALQREP